jgi:hypothetical protein
LTALTVNGPSGAERKGDNVREKIQKLINRLAKAGYPTTGEDAAELWRTLSSDHLFEPSESAKLYRKLGYEPFAGYPLQRLYRRTTGRGTQSR